MRKIVVKSRKESGLLLEDLYELTLDSYNLWKQADLDEPWMHRTFDEFCELTRDTAVFVALDADTNELLGMHCFRSDRRLRRAYGYYLSVKPSAQGEGVASQLLRVESARTRLAGFWHLYGLTAEKATWSVGWHLRNGYRIIGYKRSPDNFQTTYKDGQKKNQCYATLVFRRQLVPVSFRSWAGLVFVLRHPVYALHSNAAFCKLRFMLSFLVTNILKNRQGRIRPLFALLKHG